MARAQFDALCAALFFHAIPEERRAVTIISGQLEAYADDSGTDEESRLVIVGGLIGFADDWREFEKAWHKPLVEWSLPFGPGFDHVDAMERPRYFHMSEFAHSVGPYATWDDEDVRVERLKRLLDLICRHSVFTFGVGLSRADFDKVVSERASARLGGPYGLAAQKCFQVVAGSERSPFNVMDGKALWFLSKRPKRGGNAQILASYERNAHRPELHLGGFSIVGPEIYGAQAADIIAYELNLELQRTLGMRVAPDGEQRQRRKSLRSIWISRNAWHILTLPELQEICTLTEAAMDAEGLS